MFHYNENSISIMPTGFDIALILMKILLQLKYPGSLFIGQSRKLAQLGREADV